MLNFLKVVLATFRLTELIVKDDAPYDISLKLRQSAGRNAHKSAHHKTLADAVNCKFCMGFWAAMLIFALSRTKRLKWIVDILAIAGGQSLIETYLDGENR